jgi:hypothetical protein
MTVRLAQLCRAAGSIPAILDRYWFAAETLTHVASKLNPAQAETPVVVRVLSGAGAPMDQVALPWRRVLRWHAEQHLPAHIDELRTQVVP